MTTEEKAKAYDEAIKRAKDFMNGEAHYELKIGENIMCWVFPELRESGDEKIRKELINAFKEATGSLYMVLTPSKREAFIAWLEKQGEQILANSAKTCKDEQKLVDCIDCTNSKGCINCENGNMKETLVRKTAWSEEDEETLRWLCTFLNIYGHEFYEGNEENVIDWLKSFKSRIQLQQEWSEEDETTINNLVWAISNDCIRPQDREDYCDWLKSLKDRYSWKPSDVQIKALADALSLAKNCGEEGAFDLRTLYEQLKKLKEE